MIYDLNVGDILKDSKGNIVKIVKIGKENKIVTDKILNFQEITLMNMKTKKKWTSGYGNVQLIYTQRLKKGRKK